MTQVDTSLSYSYYVLRVPYFGVHNPFPLPTLDPRLRLGRTRDFDTDGRDLLGHPADVVLPGFTTNRGLLSAMNFALLSMTHGLLPAMNAALLSTNYGLSAMNCALRSKNYGLLSANS